MSRDRIRPPKDLEPVLDRLKEDGVFETKQKGMMFAAALGRYLDKEGRGGIELSAVGEGIRMEYFEKPMDDGFFDCMAVAQSSDLKVLEEEQDEHRLVIFEEYAHAGLAEMKRVCYGEAKHPLDGVLRLLDAVGSPQNDEPLPGLEEDVKHLEGVL